MSSERYFFAIHALDGRRAQDELNANEQWAAMARQRPGSAAAWRAIEGVGEERAGKYGAPFLAAIARAVRRLLEPPRQERPRREPQRQRARPRQPEQRLPLCPELDRRRVCEHPGMDLPLPMDQALFPVAVARWSPSKLEGSRGAGSEGAAALTRQLPGSPPAVASR